VHLSRKMQSECQMLDKWVSSYRHVLIPGSFEIGAFPILKIYFLNILLDKQCQYIAFCHGKLNSNIVIHVFAYVGVQKSNIVEFVLHFI